MNDLFPYELPLREQICAIGQLMRRYDYVDSTNGNISARLENGNILITPSGIPKGFMKPGQLLEIDMAGEKVGPGTEENQELNPSSETPMHLECYRQRDDIGGVVHAHPPFAVALTIAGVSLQQGTIPEAIIFFGEIPTSVYATPSSTENRDVMRELIRNHDAIMLSNHGSLTVAGDVWGSYLQLEALEQVAKMTFYTEMLGGADHQLEPEQKAKLVALRKSLGYPVYE